MILVANKKMFVTFGQAKKWPAALLLAILFMALLFISGCQSDSSKVVSYQGMTMGTTFTVKWVSSSENTEFQTLIDQALVAVNQSMSTYISNSELSRFNHLQREQSMRISAPLVYVLGLSKDINIKTRGAFDVTVGPMVNLWGFGPDGRVVNAPTDEEIDRVRKRVGFNFIRVDGDELSKERDSYIDLSAVAKGYGVDVIAELLEKHDISSYLVEIGGELRARGLKPDGNEWRIAIETPTSAAERTIQRIIAVKDVGIATSGDYRNYFEENGVRFSHTIDPSTGRPITHKLASVTVLMPTCAEADALATAMMVMGPERAILFAEEQHIKAFFIIKTDNGFDERMTSGFSKYLVK